jgi:hypothetical protein
MSAFFYSHHSSCEWCEQVTEYKTLFLCYMLKYLSICPKPTSDLGAEPRRPTRPRPRRGAQAVQTDKTVYKNALGGRAKLLNLFLGPRSVVFNGCTIFDVDNGGETLDLVLVFQGLLLRGVPSYIHANDLDP